MRHASLCLVDSCGHLDHLCAAEDTAFTIFFCMEEHGIASELILDLFHCFFHGRCAHRSDLHLDSHHPKDLDFNILLNLRMGEDDQPRN